MPRKQRRALICALALMIFVVLVTANVSKSATPRYSNTAVLAVWEDASVPVGGCEKVTIYARVQLVPHSTVPGQIGLPAGVHPCRSKFYTVVLGSTKSPDTYDVGSTTDWLNRPFALFFLFDPYADSGMLHHFVLHVIKPTTCMRPSYTLDEQNALRQVVCNYLP